MNKIASLTLFIILICTSAYSAFPNNEELLSLGYALDYEKKNHGEHLGIGYRQTDYYFKSQQGDLALTVTLADSPVHFERGYWRRVLRGNPSHNPVITDDMKNFLDGGQRPASLPDRNAYPGKSRLPSGLPLGDSRLIRADKINEHQHAIFQASYGNVGVQVHYMPRGKQIDGNTVFEVPDKEAASEFVEGLARTSLAHAIFEQYAYKSALEKLPSSLSSRGGHVNKNQRLGTLTVMLNGRSLLFPIGADRVKVDGKWVEIDGIVGFDGTDAVLPKSVLDKLLR